MKNCGSGGKERTLVCSMGNRLVDGEMWSLRPASCKTVMACVHIRPWPTCKYIRAPRHARVSRFWIATLPSSSLSSKEGPPDAILLVPTASAEPQDAANFILPVPHSISTLAAANSVLGASIVHYVVPIRLGHLLPIVLLYRQHEHQEREAETMLFCLFETTRPAGTVCRKSPHSPSKSPSSA
ncbi:hypothetical protein FIBSPDRAFT_591557 [Athelia psychrophila]|uniref:Uncharacterized protein n=1 Tax=Athelia psychrophila TaxID=1759441 RepID=A0A166H360_9AGAM|nr:hypothetical protein FIBSPDRAFT_591557 [Fibularhizoctonia sp. CBS 109695]